jgi:hypothetical protein
VAGALRLLAHALGVPAAELRVYDPYYCNGAAAGSKCRPP